MTDVDALLQAIHDNPDEDGPRLAYSDWLEEHGDAADRIRAEFIRLQCELARQGADAPQALSDRVEELLAAHREEWTTLAFARWLQHPKKSCGNTQGHDFCKLVSQGIRAAHERDRLPAGDPRRAYRERRLDQLERRMEDEYDYFGCTCSAPLFDEAEFRRGFVEKVTVQDYAVILYADALPDLGVIRELEIENDSTADLGDDAFDCLIAVLERLRLRTLDSSASIADLETVDSLAAAPGLRTLEALKIWFECDDNGDEAVAILAASPHLEGLRVLELEHSRTFTDAAAETALASPHLKGLTRCVLRTNEKWRIGTSVRRRWRKRFGQAPDDWR